MSKSLDEKISIPEKSTKKKQEELHAVGIGASAKEQSIRTSPKTWNQHVVPHEKGWAIKGEGNSRYTDTFRKRSTAIRRAKSIAKRHKSSVIIHRTDGSIRDRINYD